MAKPAAEVTNTELAILDVLWRVGPVGVREIVEEIYETHSASLHATVKSLLDRLDAKGYVTCDRSRHSRLYAAKVDRPAYVASQLQQLADNHFGGSTVPMLLALVDRAKLSLRDRAAIRRIVDNIE